MQREKRIEELEAELRRLKQEIEELRGRTPAESAAPSEKDGHTVSRKGAAAHGETSPLTRAGRGPGGVLLRFWAGRGVVAALMVIMVLVATAYFTPVEGAQAWRRLAVGYGIALVCILIGGIAREQRSVSVQLFLGIGLGLLYLVTYGSFFLEDLRVFGEARMAWPLLGVCFAFIVGVVLVRRSPVAATLVLPVVYYTLWSGCRYGRNDHLTYVLAAAACLATAALLFHATNRWRVVTALIMAGNYAFFFGYFWDQPAGLFLSSRDYSWVSGGLVTLSFVAFSVALVFDGYATGRIVSFVTVLALANVALYFVWMSGVVAAHALDWEWVFRLALGMYLALWTLLVWGIGDRKSSAIQAFALITTALLCLGLGAILSPTSFWLILAFGNLVLGVVWGRTGAVPLKLVGLALLVITFVGSLPEMTLPGSVTLGSYRMPANWFCCGGVGVVFLATAWLYERASPGVSAEAAGPRERWLLQDSFLDAAPLTVSVLYAGAAALLLLAVTVYELSDQPILPFVLAGEAAVFIVLGVVLLTRAIYVVSMLLLAAAYVTLYFFVRIDPAGFEDQEHAVLYPCLLAGITYLSGVMWERFLNRLEGPRRLSHYCLASIPGLLATALLVWLISRALPIAYGPITSLALGMGLLLVGSVMRHAGPVFGGLLALSAGVATYFARLPELEAGWRSGKAFVMYLALILSALAVSERLLYLLEHRCQGVARPIGLLRSLVVAAAGATGVLTLNRWAPEGLVALGWFGHAIAGMLVGLTFREARYSWAGMLIVTVAGLHAILYDFRLLPGPHQAAAIAVVLTLLALAAWSYVGFRRRTAPRPRTTLRSVERNVSSDGEPAQQGKTL